MEEGPQIHRLTVAAKCEAVVHKHERPLTDDEATAMRDNFLQNPFQSRPHPGMVDCVISLVDGITEYTCSEGVQWVITRHSTLAR